ncbi:MAG TPA: DUF4097 family beta strand repeat-containing protein [Thermoanaerobaculaceae bacterium]|nr:DUF4097 family beta strand repeat-containing protein [Thermoanaerobaculaceae bacterium]HRS16258.1 DUF4097 family beta strand repeat-containing protein [Thermoanaerobaculaceae bacterium]
MRPPLPLTVACLALAAAACHPPRREPASLHETRSFPAAEGKVVTCQLGALDVDVEVAEGDAVAVTVDLEASSSSHRAAQRWVESHTPSFVDSAGRLEIAVGPRRGGTITIGHFRTRGRVGLTLPPHCRLEVETSSGDITVHGSQPLAGAVRLRTASGDVEIRGGVDELVMRTASGDLDVRDRALASLEVRTASGDVRVRDGCGNAMVDTASGDVRLSGLVGTLSVTTSSGDVVASWARLPARVAVDTSSGDVSLELPADTRLRGAARTRSGDIRSRFEGVFEKRGRLLRWDDPTAGSEIAISTGSGDITLRRGRSRGESPVTPTPSGEGSRPRVEV